MKEVLMAIVLSLVPITAVITFAVLAVHFDTWWIALFALLFSYSARYRDEPSDKDKTKNN